MYVIRPGRVVAVLSDSGARQEVLVLVNGEPKEALAFPALTGPLAAGDSVWLNCTAVELGLGTGGRHLVVARRSGPPLQEAPPEGHLMKLRYTPWQLALPSVEEDRPDTRRAYRQQEEAGLTGMPVLLAELHSQAATALWAARRRPAGEGRAPAYIMTDAGVLPAALSRQLEKWREEGWVGPVLTADHAFGGDYETVNPLSALVAARSLGAPWALVAMGPGIVGTGSRYGWSGWDLGLLAAAVTELGGRPLLVPRLSGGDSRGRHRGVSRHTRLLLRRLSPGSLLIPWPRGFMLPGARLPARDLVRHLLLEVDVRSLFDKFAAWPEAPRSMGRPPSEDPSFFAAALAGGVAAAALAAGGQPA